MSDTHRFEEAATSSVATLHGATPLARAQARLTASRARLRLQFIPPPPPPRPPRRPGSGFISHWLQSLASGPLQFVRKLLGGNPVTEAAIDGVSHWWTTHPLRDTAELAGSEIAHEWRRIGVPLLRRHPIGSVVIAGLAGAVFVTARPWRSTRVKAQLRPLSRRIGSWLVAQVPVQAVLTSLVVMLASRSSGERTPGSAHSTSDTPNKFMK